MARRRKCAWCGDMFEAHEAADRHCSQSCGVKAAYKRLGHQNWKAAVTASVAARKRKAYQKALAEVIELLPPDATDEDKQRAVAIFRKGVQKGWMVHYDKVRLEEQRRAKAATEAAA
jgi:transcriptional regulator NrdR family protein